MELDPRPDRTTSEIRPIRIVSSVDTTTVLDSWWWTENLSETCRVLLQK